MATYRATDDADELTPSLAATTIKIEPSNDPIYVSSEEDFLAAHGHPVPTISSRVRSLVFLEIAHLWTMSLQGRRILFDSWVTGAQVELIREHGEELDRLVAEHEEAQKEYLDLQVRAARHLRLYPLQVSDRCPTFLLRLCWRRIDSASQGGSVP